MKKHYRFLALALFFALCLSIFPQAATVLAAPSDKTVIIAGSDFQSYESNPHNACKNQVNDIFAQIQKDYDHADGFLFAGDYYHQYENAQSEAGMDTLVNTVLDSGMGISPEAIVLGQGNHDQVGTRGFSPSGENDPASGKYGVFLINEDDFMWFAGNEGKDGSYDVRQHEATVKKTAENLAAYLDEKADQNFREPIFVVSHLPLHYSMRTYVYGDGQYAGYIFDELNYGAERGLNIVFLFGHNHSHNWDNHLGGSAIYLQRGDSINIPTGRYSCTEETLGFTYLNAGYVGYFTTDNNEPVDKTLTMTVYEFGDGEMKISRYSKDGLHSLKSAGVENWNVYSGRYSEEGLGLFDRDRRKIDSPITVTLVKETQEPVSPTCQTEGTEGYYITYDGVCYKDIGLKGKTTPSAQKLDKVEHKYRFIDNKDGTHTATCDYCQSKEKPLPHNYYSTSCELCGSYRSVTKVPAKEPTCSEEGNIEHFYHADTDSYFEDRRAQFPLSREDVILPKLPHAYKNGMDKNATGHWRICSCGQKEDLQKHTYENGFCKACGYEKPLTLTKVEATESTCTANGNRAYYYDAQSDSYYKDAAGTQPTTLEEVTLPLEEHDYNSRGKCRNCSAKDPNYLPPATVAPSSSIPASTAPSTSAPATVIPSGSAPGSSLPVSAPASSVPATASSSAAVSSVPSSTKAPSAASSCAAKPSDSLSAAPSANTEAATTTTASPENTPDLLPYVILGCVVLALVVGLAVILLLRKKKK